MDFSSGPINLRCVTEPEETKIESTMPRTVLVQRQIVVTAALVVGALMLMKILECVSRAMESPYYEVSFETWITLLLFMGMGAIVWRGIERPSWVKVVWVVIATVYFTAWSCWSLAFPSHEAVLSKTKLQLTIPSATPRPKTNYFGGVGR
ncbi:hypothetical protein BH09VER1_BH09VER1_42290 [soil metagenome]